MIFLHAGNNITITENRIIGIFDTDTATVADTTKDYLRKAEKDGRVDMTVEDLPKSFIVTDDNYVLYAQVSVDTLINRA